MKFFTPNYALKFFFFNSAKFRGKFPNICYEWCSHLATTADYALLPMLKNPDDPESTREYRLSPKS